MQFLPSTTLDFAGATPLVGEQAQDAFNRLQNGPSFNEVYSSFIQEGRETYTGLPPGFDAHIKESGTLDRESADLLHKQLKKRGAREASLETLDQLLAAGGPLTIGRIFAALSGASRTAPELEGHERLDFQQVMQKMGFSADEADEMLQLSDKGYTAAMWRRINRKLEGLEQMELHGEELAALLKGLDISEGVRSQIQKLFSENQSAALSRGQLETLLAEAGRELAARDMAAGTVRRYMRAAVEDALAEAKLNNKALPSSDAKGTSWSDRSESLMQHAVNKKIDAGLNDTAGRDASGKDAQREDPGFAKEGMGRAERILAKARPEGEAAPVKKGGAEAVIERIMRRIDNAAMPQTPQQFDSGPQVSTAELAGRHRQEIFTQVEQGLLSGTAAGGGRLTLQLNPQELGQINVMLSVHNGEVRAVIRAENPESAAVLSEQLQQLRASLEEAGLKVAELDVQTGLREDFTAQTWNGADQHNLMHDAEERARERRLAGLRRDTTHTGTEHLETATQPSREGLHIVA